MSERVTDICSTYILFYSLLHLPIRVRGVIGLRVVDTSIMPQLISANTMAAAYMIGEKGADMIKEDWGYPIDPLPIPRF